jgi:hypothetical protein
MPNGHSTTSTIDPAEEKIHSSRRLLNSFFQQRICIVPTWRGWVAILLVAFFCMVLIGSGLCAFLTVNQPVPGGVLVVEGWAPGYVASAAVEEFHRHSYVGIYATGIPMTDDNGLIGADSGNFADVMAEKLRKLGVPEASIHAVPAPDVGRDRTYSMATTLKRRLEADGVSTANINIYSLGPHSRRSRLLYEFAFGPSSKIGIVAIDPRDYNSRRWWATSEGFRAVVGEFIAYVYARVLFHPGKNS